MKLSDKIFYKKYGEGSLNLICIHGFGASHLSFEKLGFVLKDKYTLYAIDLAGFGESKIPEKFNFSIQEQAELVSVLIQQIDLRNYHLLGHSYGGAVVLKLLTLECFIKINQPKHIFLISPLAYEEKYPFFIKVLTNSFLNFLNRKLVPPKLQARIILRYLFFDNSKITSHKINSYALYYRSKINTKTLTKTANKLKLGDGTEMFNKYKNISQSISIYYGNKDKLISRKNIYKLQEKLENSLVYEIDNCGHIPHEENIIEVKKLIQNIKL